MPGTGQPRGGGSRRAVGRVVGPTLWQVLTLGPEHGADVATVQAVRDDVLRNIATLLSAHRGRCYGHREFGLPDLNEFFVSPRGLLALAREIKHSIERWEPRIAPPVQVRVLKGPREGGSSGEGIPQASFIVRAKLAAPWDEVCTFRTMLLPDGQAKVAV